MNHVANCIVCGDECCLEADPFHTVCRCERHLKSDDLEGMPELRDPLVEDLSISEQGTLEDL